ncbi:hypothetical protein [Dyadobacter luticola]|uniref:Uncharacterized protein n=1 Tax=Dyadobacter luticola TaxID=1979387 RepID=A0A5R9L0Y0_9BACT|nr:hypothetical protein [Dyadobacter luticola]TLV02194.1 hypothetical protein FEN17_00705 [Dyadobacter luticola]
MIALENLIYALEMLTHVDVPEEGHPKIKVVIQSVRNLVENLNKLAPDLKKCMSEDEFEDFKYLVDDVVEAADDVEHIFFELRLNKDFMAAFERLSNTLEARKFS